MRKVCLVYIVLAQRPSLFRLHQALNSPQRRRLCLPLSNNERLVESLARQPMFVLSGYQEGRIPRYVESWSRFVGGHY